MIQNRDLVREFYRSLVETSGRAMDLWLELEEGGASGEKPLKRLLHTVKGEAHLLGLTGLGGLAMALEELVIRAHAADAIRESSDVVLEAIEILGIVAAAEGAPEAADVAAATAKVKERAEALPKVEKAGEAARAGEASRPAEPAGGAVTPQREEAETPEAAARREGYVSVEDVLTAVNDLGRLQGEQALLMPQLREAQRILRSVLAEMDPTLPPAVLGEQVIKTLGFAEEAERRITAVRSMWSANAHSTNLALDKLADATRRAALVSVGRLRTQLTMAARAAANALGKDVSVYFEGDAYIDAAVSRRLETALLHAVRNSVDHGIESRADRVAAGKPAHGTIRIRVDQDASTVRTAIRDDGRGVDYAALRRKLGLDPDDDTPESQLIQKLFVSGVTTRDSASDISGRGIGLDVIAGEAAEAGGNVTARSVVGMGFELVIEMPVVMRADHVVPIQVGRHQVALPSRNVERFLRVVEVESTSEGPMVHVRAEGHADSLVPLWPLHRAFDDTPPPMVGASALVVNFRSDRAAILVDRSESPRTMTFQPIAELACTSPLVRAVAPLPDGTVRLLLDVPSVFRILRGAGAELARQSTPTESKRARVLVVEDAPVARELLCGILRSFGLVVVEAAHGKEGLERLRQQPFDLLLSDVEMPFIGGLEMIETAREKLGLVDLPVVVLTTDASEGTRRKAAALGVRAFLTKQRFVEDELRTIVDRCLERK